MAKDEKLYEPQIPICFQKHPGQFYEYFNKKIQPCIFVPDFHQLVAFIIVYSSLELLKKTLQHLQYSTYTHYCMVFGANC